MAAYLTIAAKQFVGDTVEKAIQQPHQIGWLKSQLDNLTIADWMRMVKSFVGGVTETEKAHLRVELLWTSGQVSMLPVQ